MILDSVHKVFIPSLKPSNSRSASLEALLLDAISCLLMHQRREVRSFVVVIVGLFRLFGYQRCSQRLQLLQATGPAVVLSRQYSYKTGCIGVTANLLYS